MSVDMEQYKQTFLEEAEEHIDLITQSLLVLEKDRKNPEALNNIFRSAHTLKSSSAMMGYKDISELTHAMEDIFDGLRKGGQASSELITTLLECIDILTARLGNIKNGEGGEIEVTSLLKKLHGVSAEINERKVVQDEPNTVVSPDAWNCLSQDQRSVAKEAIENGKKCFHVHVKFASDCAFKPIRADMVLDNLAGLGHIIGTNPSKEDISDKTLDAGLKILITSDEEEKQIVDCVKSICEVDEALVNPVELSSSITEASKSEGSSSVENKTTVDTRLAQTVRVHFDDLDKLMNLVGELVINKIALVQILSETRNEALKRVTDIVDRLTNDLHDLVMRIRMVPVGQIFDRFPRLVRDLSMKKGKMIDLVMTGKEIEVDRTVLDEIGQPLIHLIRNSIDHGIEQSDNRLKAGKSQIGSIRLAAQRKGEHVILEVSDDGAGIDPEKVKDAALQKGFISKEDSAKMNKDQLINLIFLPGLSTAKEITDTSGRGVGMDVVKSKITALGGTVQLESHIGLGTKVTLRLPLTLAIIKALLVKDTGQVFAVPASQVSEVIRVESRMIKSLGSFSATLLRGQVLPILHLHEFLNLESTESNGHVEVLVTHGSTEDKKVGFAVDSVLGHQEILIKSLEKSFAESKGFSGTTILGDGKVIPVLDLGEFTGQRATAKS